MRRLQIALIGLLLLALLPAHAQDAPAWEVILSIRSSNADGGQVITVTPSGVTQTVEVLGTSVAYPDVLPIFFELSPNGQYLAYHISLLDDNNVVLPVYIMDLHTGKTIETRIDAASNFHAYELGAFDPTNRQLAISYIGSMSSTGDPYPGGIALVDAVSGEIVQDMPMREVPEPVSDIWAYLGDWTADGIQFHPNCYGCEGVYEGLWSIWNPLTDEFQIEMGGYFNSIFASPLPMTGEVLLLNHVQIYPFNPVPDYFPPANVVQYFVGDLVPPLASQTGAPSIYFNENDIDLTDNRVYWVNDGDEFVVSSARETTWIVTSRYGGRRFVEVPEGSTVLTGVTDGWIGTQPNGDQVDVVYARLIDGEYQITPLHTFTGRAQVLQAPELGAGVSTPPMGFPIIDPPSAERFDAIMLANAPVCEGLPTRLYFGRLARVTPGESNRIRQSPNTRAEIVGSIPAGGLFRILDGPTCAEGYTWWFVEYEGALGYTVEGAGDTYFIEPAD